MKPTTTKQGPLKLSAAMIAMLEAVRDYNDAGHHIRNRSQAGGSGKTWVALYKAGYVRHVNHQDFLTPPGANALANLKRKP